jgi:hypothetical protein
MRMQRRSIGLIPCGILFASMALTGGCSHPTNGPLVIFLDGAGWYSGSGSVESGLRQAGYTGDFETFSWSSYLGPVPDHFLNARSPLIAQRLANKVEEKRAVDPDSPIHLIGLSAGTSLILSALEELKDDVAVDNVVLFSPSVSADHNLTKAMQHVRRNLYATCSPHDGILKGLPGNADGKGGAPAGLRGFRPPRKSGPRTMSAYNRVINIPWQASYAGFGWTGSHVSVTSRDFVASVISPRIMSSEPYPLDRPSGELYASRMHE